MPLQKSYCKVLTYVTTMCFVLLHANGQIVLLFRTNFSDAYEEVPTLWTSVTYTLWQL